MSELEQASAACWKALGLAMLAGVMVIASLHNRAAEAVVVCGVMKMVVWLSIGANWNREVIRLMAEENTWDYDEACDAAIRAMWLDAKARPEQ